MKIVCASCGHEHEQPAERCARCAEPLAGWTSSAPTEADPGGEPGEAARPEETAAPEVAAAANFELDAIRDEIEAEVGSLFEVEPDRALHTSNYLLGDRRQRARTPTDPGVPAYRVVEVSSPRKEANPKASAAADPSVPAVEAQTASDASTGPGQKSKPPASAAPAPATPDTQESEEAEWRPAASALASLMQEEMSSARERETEEQVDELIRPPVLKAKPLPGPEPAPPPAFDEDVPGGKSSGAGFATAAGPQGAQGSARSEGSARGRGSGRQSKLLLGLAAIGALVIFALLTIIVVLLLQQPQYSTGTPVVTAPPPATPATPGDPRPGGLVPIAAPENTPGVSAAKPPDAGRTDTSMPDTSLPDTSAPDTAQPDTAPPPPPPRVEPPVAVAEAPEADLPAWAERATRSKSKDPKVKEPKAGDPSAAASEQKPAEPPPKPKLPPGARPPGCDPIAYPDPKDCPADRPPSKSEILAVVRRHVKDIDRCAKKQHAIDPALASGVITISWWIYPSGKTKQVKVASPEFQNTVVGNCLESAIEAWDFGEYSGKRVGPIKMPFKLATK